MNFKSIFNKDKRKRFSRPLTILLIGILLCILPIINYFFIAKELGFGSSNFGLIFHFLSAFEITLLLLPLVLGVGLLMIRKWAWWGILLYFTSLILYDTYLLFSLNSMFNVGVLFRTIVGFGIIIFFLKKDISAPYFKLYPRGWRGEKRKPIERVVYIKEKEYKTFDVSPTGVYLDWKDCDRELGDELVIRFIQNDDGHLQTEAKVGIVRIDTNGVGLAFRR